MSVETSELISDVWTQWQGHVIDDAFPLGRYLGCSDHSGVFLTSSAALGPADVVIKLVPADRALAESQLSRWRRAADLEHPHLLRLLQSGKCQLDGLPYLYVVMEYADQTLAQLLQRRLLTDDEAREMLLPILDALGFVQGRGLVQGRLKPENVLVVGEQLKLASDTIRRLDEDRISAEAHTAYDPPEASHGNNSTAGDIWALGVCLLDALIGRVPQGVGERSEAVVLPLDFSPVFKEPVARCLQLSPQNRPSVAELMAWARGQALSPMPTIVVPEAASSVPAAISVSEAARPVPAAVGVPPAPKPAPAAIVAPKVTITAPRMTPPSVVPDFARPPVPPRRPQAVITAVVAVAAILVLGWIGVSMVRSHRTPTTPPVLESAMSPTQDASAPVAADVSQPTASVSPAESARSEPPPAISAPHEVMPDVSPSARRKIKGHVEVTVRIIVDSSGAVIAATSDRSAHSRRFQHLAAEAARKWTFPPSPTQPRRTMQIQFDFGRDETTGQVVTSN